MLNSYDEYDWSLLDIFRHDIFIDAPNTKHKMNISVWIGEATWNVKLLCKIVIICRNAVL